MLRGRGRVVDDEVHHAVGADVAQTRPKDHREDLVLANGVVQRWNQVLDRDRPFLEELFHQLVVALGDQFDQLLMRFLGLIFQVGGDFGFLAFAIAAEFVGEAFIWTRSTTPVKFFSLPMGSSKGITARPNAFVSDSSTRSASARSRSMRLATISLGVLNSSQ